jgi:hypothetical protein
VSESTIETQLRNAERTLDAHEHRIGTLEVAKNATHDELVRAKSAFAKLTKLVEGLAQAAQEEVEPPFSWIMATDPITASEQLTALESWTNRVLVHFPGGRLPDCWRRHPEVVEWLFVLMDGHTQFWAPKAKVNDRFDWTNRWVPETVKRINSAIGSCGLTAPLHTGIIPEHRDGVKTFQSASQPGLDRIEASAWVATKGVILMPAPTQEAILESRTREDEAFAQMS